MIRVFNFRWGTQQPQKIEELLHKFFADAAKITATPEGWEITLPGPATRVFMVRQQFTQDVLTGLLIEYDQKQIDDYTQALIDGVGGVISKRWCRASWCR